MNVEHELRRALRREAPAPGFAQRVLARIEQEERETRWSPRRWRTLAASLILTASIGGYAFHEAAERRREAGERARDQVLQAMRIAGAKVAHAREEVRQIGSEQ